jgi:hypothetical protein
LPWSYAKAHKRLLTAHQASAGKLIWRPLRAELEPNHLKPKSFGSFAPPHTLPIPVQGSQGWGPYEIQYNLAIRILGGGARVFLQHAYSYTVFAKTGKLKAGTHILGVSRGGFGGEVKYEIRRQCYEVFLNPLMLFVPHISIMNAARNNIKLLQAKESAVRNAHPLMYETESLPKLFAMFAR